MKIVNILFFAAMVTMNYLANALPLNGKNTGELSGMYPNLFVPAGITFSIWGVIYLMLFLFCVLQFRDSNHLSVAAIGWLFAWTCLFNSLWIVAWHYGEVGLSVVVMVALLATLIAINFHIKALPMGLIKAAFGVYLGWICIATIANITALLVHVGWGGFGFSDEIWTILLIVVGAFLALGAMKKMDNPFILLSVVWAFIGIMIKRQADYRSIFIASAVFALVLAVSAILAFFRKSLI